MIKPVADEYGITPENIANGEIQVQTQGIKTILRLPDRTETLLRGKPHSFSAPAQWNDEAEVWYENGVIHRVGGPARITKGTIHSECWMQNGEYHRTDGPAHTRPGLEIWFLNGKHHRIGKPAIIKNKGQQWYAFGQPHRTDGPAVLVSYYNAWNILFPITHLNIKKNFKQVKQSKALLPLVLSNNMIMIMQLVFIANYQTH